MTGLIVTHVRMDLRNPYVTGWNMGRLVPNFTFPDHRFRNFQFSGQNRSFTHILGPRFSGSIFQNYRSYIRKLWNNADRFDPVGIHIFRTNRSGPSLVTAQETRKNDLRVSKLISRGLCPLSRKTLKNVSWAIKSQKHVCLDRLWHHFTTPLFLTNPLHCRNRNRFLHARSPKRTNTCSSKITFSSRPLAYWTMNHTIFSVVFILKHPSIIFCQNALHIRTPLLSSQSVSHTLNFNFHIDQANIQQNFTHRLDLYWESTKVRSALRGS